MAATTSASANPLRSRYSLAWRERRIGLSREAVVTSVTFARTHAAETQTFIAAMIVSVIPVLPVAVLGSRSGRRTSVNHPRFSIT